MELNTGRKEIVVGVNSGCCITTSCDYNIVNPELQSANLDNKRVFYDFRNKFNTEQQQVANQLIESISSDACLAYPAFSCAKDMEILRYEIMLLKDKFLKQICTLAEKTTDLKFANLYNIYLIFLILKTNPLCIKFIFLKSYIGKVLLFLLIDTLKLAHCGQTYSKQYDKPHLIENICWRILGYTSFYWKRRHFQYSMKQTFHWRWIVTMFEFWRHQKDSLYSLWMSSSKKQFKQILIQQFTQMYCGNIRPDSHFIAMKTQVKWPMEFFTFESVGLNPPIKKQYNSLEHLRNDSIYHCNAGHVDFCAKHKSEDRQECYIECISVIGSLFFTTIDKTDITKFNNLKYCSFCQKNKQNEKDMTNKLMICKGCKLAYYCSKRCQKLDWKIYDHKKICFRLKQTLC